MACEQPRLSTLIANHDKVTIAILAGVGFGGLVLGMVVAFAISKWRGGKIVQRNDLDQGSFLKLQSSITLSSTRKSTKADRWSTATSSGPRAIKRLSSKFAEMHKGLSLPKPIAQDGGERNYSPRLDSFPPSPSFPLVPIPSRTDSDTRTRKYSEASEYTVVGNAMGSLEKQKQIDESSIDHDSSFHRSILNSHGGASVHAHSTAYDNHPWSYATGSSSGLGPGSSSQRQDMVKRSPTSVSTGRQVEPQLDVRLITDENPSPKTLQFPVVGDQVSTVAATSATQPVLSPSSDFSQASPVSNQGNHDRETNEPDQLFSETGAGPRKGLVRQVSNGRAASFYKEQATKHLSLAHVHRAVNSPVFGLPDSPGGVMGNVAHENNNFSFARGHVQSDLRNATNLSNQHD